MKKLLTLLRQPSLEGQEAMSAQLQMERSMRQTFGNILNRLFGVIMPGCTHEVRGRKMHVLHHFEDHPGYYLLTPALDIRPEEGAMVSMSLYYHPETARLNEEALTDPTKICTRLADDSELAQMSQTVMAAYRAQQVESSDGELN